MGYDYSTVTIFGRQIIWYPAFLFISIHLGFIVGLYQVYMNKVMGYTVAWILLVYVLGAFAAGPGGHRHFAHRAFKVTDGFKKFLLFCYALGGTAPLEYFVRNHRTHHKHVDTDKDPTNINRGFWYAYGGFLMIPSPAVEKAMDEIYMDDILNDKYIMFLDKYFKYFVITITFGFPSIVPYLFWNESIYIAFWVNMVRYGVMIIQTSFGNSVLHTKGLKTYDKSHTAVDNILHNIIMLGEGYHNFHHTFPYDYRCNERYKPYKLNEVATVLIDFFSLFGLIYDKKTISDELIIKRALKTGDGSHWMSKNDDEKLNNNQTDAKDFTVKKKELQWVDE